MYGYLSKLVEKSDEYSISLKPRIITVDKENISSIVSILCMLLQLIIESIQKFDLNVRFDP
ncbi:MAG: hypothetical protein K0S34_1597 [Bacillales bacterium]|jgi:hypothetical protein|nr:hypothetical protein [Bacillales bacterium]